MATETAYTIETLAARWVCSKDVIYDLLWKKQLKGFKVGKSWRIPAREVDRFENNE